MAGAHLDRGADGFAVDAPITEGHFVDDDPHRLLRRPQRAGNGLRDLSDQRLLDLRAMAGTDVDLSERHRVLQKSDWDYFADLSI